MGVMANARGYYLSGQDSFQDPRSKDAAKFGRYFDQRRICPSVKRWYFQPKAVHSRPPEQQIRGQKMNQDAAKKKTAIKEAVEKAFNQIHDDYGISENDLFMASLGYSSVGLVLVNLDWLPSSFHALGWTLIFFGVPSMVFIRKLL